MTEHPLLQPPPPEPAGAPWQRLSVRVIWVDIVVSLLALSPGAIAIWVVGVPPTSGAIIPLAILAGFGVLGAVGDIIRWSTTTYRVTPTDVERRTGLFTRRHRTIHRDRIRSIDTSAKLRHRLSGLRVVTVGAGQQSAAGESALDFDALTAADAAALRKHLLSTDAEPARDVTPVPASSSAHDEPAHEAADATEPAEPREAVLVTFRPWWVVYNAFSVWAFAFAAGLLWGGYWFVSSFGLDVFGFVGGIANWETLGLGWTIAIGVVVTGIVGATGLGVSFLLGYWYFTLTRVQESHTSYLRTQRGFFSTREVNRDEARIRGLSIGEPLLWRWMGMADTNVITTGLSVWSLEQPAAILPRGPVSEARRVAAKVFGAVNPFDAPLQRHPRAALRRRLGWATALSAIAPIALALPAITGVIPWWVPLAALVPWPILLVAAVIAYRALGHAITGDYLVVRAGLFSRTTSALRRDAVSTIAVRQSLLQRRLGLATVSAMTAAGWYAYEAPDVASIDSVALAEAMAPGVLDDFVERVR